MHLLVLGATGPSGLAFVQAALNRSHQVTIYARNPSKLPHDVATHPDVTVVTGTFEDRNAVTQALRTGATVLISFAGPALPSKGTPVTQFYETLFPQILHDLETTIQRCLCCTTPSFSVPEDQPSWKWSLLVRAIQLVGGSAYAEVNGIGRVVSSLPLDQIEWTLFRVPRLTNGGAKPVRAGLIGEGQDGITLSRASIAAWILRELEEKRWIGKAPALYNPGWI